MLQSVCIHRLGALSLRHRFPGNVLLMLSAARPAALSAGLTRFLTAPFVSGSSQVRRSPALAGNLTLLVTVHRRKTAILYTHNVLIHQNVVISTASQAQMSATSRPVCHACDYEERLQVEIRPPQEWNVSVPVISTQSANPQRPLCETRARSQTASSQGHSPGHEGIALG